MEVRNDLLLVYSGSFLNCVLAQSVEARVYRRIPSVTTSACPAWGRSITFTGMYPTQIASESLTIIIDEVLIIFQGKMHEVSDPSSVPILHLVMLVYGVLQLLMDVSFSSGKSLISCSICVWVHILTPTLPPRSPTSSPRTRLWLLL